MPTTQVAIPPSPDTYADDIARLQHALTTASNEREKQALKTLMEQLAGRKSLQEVDRNEKTHGGLHELQRRFGRKAVLSACWEIREDRYWVDVLVQPADGAQPITYTELLIQFPSDECIANIALVV